MNKIIQSLLVLIAALSLITCSSSSDMNQDLNGDNKKMQSVFNVGDNRLVIPTFGNFIQTATGGSGTGSITYESENQAVATVDINTGEVTLLSVGKTTITATKGGDETYKAISDDYTLTIAAQPLLRVVFSGIKTFEFSWSNIPIEFYELLEDSDGSGNFTQIGENILKDRTSFDLSVALYKRVNASYKIRGCIDSNTCVESELISIDVSDLVDSSGYFKASNTGGEDNFGNSVSLSADGNTLAVGAGGEDSNAIGVNENEDNNSASGSGAVYVFTRTEAGWAQEAYIKASNTGGGDEFGNSVSLSADGNTLAVGAVGEDSNAIGVNENEDNNSASGSGAVYVFTRTGTDWAQETYIKASNTGGGDKFGYSVSLSADGNTLAVGAYNEDSNAEGVNQDEGNNSASNSGAVYVFTRTGIGWTQKAYIKASNTGEDDFFGNSVSLSADGNTLAVGAFLEDSNAEGVNKDESDNSIFNSGAVYVFSLTGTSWAQEAYIKASNTASISSGDEFGSSVSLSADGNTLAVGAIFEDSNAEGVNQDEDNNSASNSGAVYVFTRTEAGWAQEAYIKASNTGGGDDFGNSVSLSADGNTLAVGAYNEDSNGEGVNADGDDNSASNSGAVYVFTRTGIGWTQKAYIKASNTGEDDFFGNSVSLSADGNTLAVGANDEDSDVTDVSQGLDSQINNSAEDSGAVYLY